MVTGLCIPCGDLVEAASASLAFDLNQSDHVFKICKDQGQWYVVVVFNRG